MPYVFEGALFDFDSHNLKDNITLAAHFIHSITMMRYNQGKLNYYKGMDYADLYESNKAFFDAVKIRYEHERKYVINAQSLISGLKWFLKGVSSN